MYFGFASYRSGRALEEKMLDLGLALTQNLAYSSELAVLSCDSTFLISIVHGVTESEDILFMIVYSKEGAIISHQKKIEIPDEGLSAELLREIESKKESLIKRKKISGNEYYDFIVPVIRSGHLGYLEETNGEEVIGFARIGLSLASIKEEQKLAVLVGSIATFLVISLGFIGSAFMAKRMTLPLYKLKKGAEKIGKGNFNYRVELKTSDEFGDLANAFNQMAKSVQESNQELKSAKEILEIKVKRRTIELEELTQDLEKKVKARTKELEASKEELQERVGELEKFQHLAVGRELRMIELKDKIKDLKTDT